MASLNLRFISLNILSFLVMLTYGVVKSPIDSLFLQYQSAQQLPIAWIMMMGAAFLTMEVLNQFNSRYSMLKVFGWSSCVSALFLIIFGGLFYLNNDLGVYGLYIWKEVYIVVLVEVFWSFANLVYSVKAAKWSYGILLMSGSLGSVFGYMLIGDVAKYLGTTKSLFVSFPIFALVWVIPLIWYRLVQDDRVAAHQKEKGGRIGSALNVVLESKYLTPLFLLVIVSQIGGALVEYELNLSLKEIYTNVDERTAIIGNINAVMSGLASVMQLFTWQIFKVLGVGGTLAGMPIILLITLVAFLIYPQFSTVMVARIAGKTFDYSILRAAKEILYIPLTRAEKTQGKAMIDIFAYRIARGICSLLLLALAALNVSTSAMYFSIAAMIAWAGLALVIAKRFRETEPAENEAWISTVISDSEATTSK